MSIAQKCSIKDCKGLGKPNKYGRRYFIKGYCGKHLKKYYKYGDATFGLSHSSHGMSSTSTYMSWENMRARCNNPNNANYYNYGYRNIKVCDRWSNFNLFLQDMGERPEGMTLDRLDPNKDYFPENCRWADSTTQVLNTRIDKRNSTGYRGVGVFGKKYKACITSNYTSIWIGSFNTPEEAAWMYDQWAISLHNGKAPLNFDYI